MQFTHLALIIDCGAQVIYSHLNQQSCESEKNFSYACMYHCARLLYTIQHRLILIQSVLLGRFLLEKIISVIIFSSQWKITDVLDEMSHLL